MAHGVVVQRQILENGVAVNFQAIQELLEGFFVKDIALFCGPGFRIMRSPASDIP